VRQILTFLLPLFLTAAIYSQQSAFRTHYVKKHTTNQTTVQKDTVNNASADTLWRLTGTGMDTSRIYKARTGFITFSFLQDDTSAANDSADVEYKIYAAAQRQFNPTVFPAFSKFVLQDSVTISGQTAQDWVYTSTGTNRPNVENFYITAEGTADNKTLSAVELLIEVSFTD
jgi:hypothetical protein